MTVVCLTNAGLIPMEAVTTMGSAPRKARTQSASSAPA
jgi:hypothetical protein